LKDNKRLILGLGGAPVILLSLAMLFNFALVTGKLSFLECTKQKNLLMGKRGFKCTITRFSGSAMSERGSEIMPGALNDSTKRP
jgi:hypothetical protein